MQRREFLRAAVVGAGAVLLNGPDLRAEKREDRPNLLVTDEFICAGYGMGNRWFRYIQETIARPCLIPKAGKKKEAGSKR